MEIREFNKSIIEEFRANDGKVGGEFSGAPLLLLTTTGAKTGKTGVNPLAYLEDGDRYVIIASYAGADHNPPWYHNLLAHPDVTVEVGTERIDVHARTSSRSRNGPSCIGRWRQSCRRSPNTSARPRARSR